MLRIVMTPVVRRLVLALAFLAGSWEDILPGINFLAPRAFDAPLSSRHPSGSLPKSTPDEDAGLGFLLYQAPVEQVLLLDVEIAPVVVSKLNFIAGAIPVAFTPVFIRLIPHVPKSPSFL